MAIATDATFHRFKQRIKQMTEVSPSTLKSPQFLVANDEKTQIEIYYAPFEYVNERAKVVIVGITPGLFQMEQAFKTIQESKETETDEQLLSKVKNASSFQGQMRKNLVSMLDELGLHQYLDLPSTATLFNFSSSLVHTTSVIRYPVFHKGKNYSGTTPSMLKHPLLRKYVTTQLASELKQMNDPLIIPLGVKVEKVLAYLVEQSIIRVDSILGGFPHPSGQNGWRKRHFEAAKAQMMTTLQTYFKRQPIDASMKG